MSDPIEVEAELVETPAPRKPILKAPNGDFLPGTAPGGRKPGVRNRIQSGMLHEFAKYLLEVDPSCNPLLVLAKLSIGIRPGPGGVDVVDASIPPSVMAASSGISLDTFATAGTYFSQERRAAS